MILDFTKQLSQHEPLTADLVDKKDIEFYNFNIVDQEEVFDEMNDVFGSSALMDEEYRFSYFRWYTDLAWKSFNNRDRDFVINIAMARQVPMAILLDFEVWRNVMWYLAMRTLDRQDMEEFYFKMREAFLNSEAIVGKWQGKNILVKDLVNEIKSLNARAADSMENAEFESRLQQIMFDKNNPFFETYVSTDLDTAVDRFIGLVNFFLGIDEKHIWYTVESFLHPEKFENPTLQNIIATSSVRDKTEPAPQNSVNKYESMSQKLDAEIKAMESAATPVAKVEPEKPAVPSPTPKEASVAEAPAKLSATQIKSKIESEFKQDLDGNFVDIEGVMRKLEEFAETYNDPKIADMIYYDEEDDKFKWKV